MAECASPSPLSRVPIGAMPTAFLFPGQGSQTPEMRDVVEESCPELLERAAHAVGEDPFERVSEGTKFAQPALYCASVALWQRAGSPRADFIAGHSLGELGGLVAGGSLSREDGLWLAARRGSVMQEVAAKQREGGMLALLGDEEAARRIAGAHELTIANDNAPGQLVVSGPGDDLEAARDEAKGERLKAMPLAVRGAFHTDAMAPALPEFREALDQLEVRLPEVPVFSSITARPFTDIRHELTEALVQPVRWRETLIALRDRGVERFVEVGPGKVLKGLVRRTLPDVEAEILAAPEVAHA
jgi:[acyl-carrier-protein] S-malonyltransferase